jgi:methylated-DNA-[protein]-cysteine S-methyltransferase
MNGSIQFVMKSQVGPIYLVASEKGLRGAFWKRQNAPTVRALDGKNRLHKILRQTVRQLEEYFSGKRRLFELPLDVQGTDFQKSVWTQLSKIPYGETCSYRDIAKRLKNGRAVRAVGTANGRNPLSIIVPCHRVIAADGTLAGYAGGLEIKAKLLAIEKGN